MFGRKDSLQDESQQETLNIVQDSPVASPRPADITRASPVPAARRAPDVAVTQRRTPSSSASGDSVERKLTVGRGLSLSGEITSCDILVVEGKVEAKLADGKMLEITESGQFNGSVEIDNADIAGRYEGNLTVHGRLTVRSTGRISGIVKYGELEVNAGGQIIGEIQVAGGGSASESSPSRKSGPSFKNAARFASAADDEDSADSRRAANG